MNNLSPLSPSLAESDTEDGDATRPDTSVESNIRENAKRLRTALFAIGRNLLSVDDSTLDLPFRQFRVCVALHGRTASMSAIGRELGLSLSSMTQIADRLERVGLVERVSEGTDRRVRYLKLTEKGERLMQSHADAQLRRISSCLKDLPNEQTEEVLASLAVLIRASEMQHDDGHHR